MDSSQLGSLDEGALVTRLRRTGDGRFFAELYRRERRDVFGLCLRYLREPALAEEVCHDAFVRAWERWESFRGERFGAWVRTIAVRAAIDRLRREKVRREAPSERPPGPPATDASVIARQELERAREILADLRPEQRRVFLLRHLDGMSYREIAAVTGLDDGAVRSHLQNARRGFRLAWERQATATSEGHG